MVPKYPRLNRVKVVVTQILKGGGDLPCWGIWEVPFFWAAYQL